MSHRAHPTDSPKIRCVAIRPEGSLTSSVTKLTFWPAQHSQYLYILMKLCKKNHAVTYGMFIAEFKPKLKAQLQT